MLGLLTLPFLMQANAAAQENSDPVRAYIDCVVVQATILEPSGEPAQTIAEAAIPKCEPLIEQAASTMSDEWLAKPEVQRLPPNLQGVRADLDEQNRKLLRDGARKAVVRVVVEDRAKKANAAND